MREKKPDNLGTSVQTDAVKSTTVLLTETATKLWGSYGFS